MKQQEKIKRIDDILNRGVITQVLPSKEAFRARLLSGESMRFYIGADPTSDSLHLSHAKNFMLMEEFRQLGHKVFVLFGDVTACIGDPSDRTSARTRLTRAEAQKNVQGWVRQISPLINFEDKENPAEVVLNSAWFDKMSVAELLDLFSLATFQRLSERDMFQKRLAQNKPIHVNEFVYPIFQGFDSVALDADVEVCGTDQIFNALMGRALVKHFKNKEKFVVNVNLMENPVTGALMSKSNGTGVFLKEDAITLFGQIMAQPDEMIRLFLINNTRLSLQEIEALDIANHPKEAKMRAAKEIVRLLHGEALASEACRVFVDTFSNKDFPDTAPTVSLSGIQTLFELVKKCLPTHSNSEIRRLIIQGAVWINGVKKTDEQCKLSGCLPLQIKIGKRRFFKGI